MIKLLIVDDSALMRRQLMNLFQAESNFEVHQARNGEEAVRENRDFQPDVVTLDINMPEMDGLTALSLIMVERPTAVVMVSSLTNEGALATFEALNLGAVDYVAKPGGTISLSLDRITKELIEKVRSAARARPRGKVTTAATVVRRMQEERKKVARTSSAVVAPRSAGNEILVVGIHGRAAGAGDCAVGIAGKLSLAGAGGATHAGGVYQGFCRAAESVLCIASGRGEQRTAN
jgi:two-component system chemotaxis response regulator CheB